MDGTESAPTAAQPGGTRTTAPPRDGGGRGPRTRAPRRPRVDGAAILTELRDALIRFVVFPTGESADAVTLWIAATHAQSAWEHAPRLAVISPEKRCGKSRLIDIAEQLAHKALVTVNISPAALVRSIEANDPPTLFIDEADTIWGPKAADTNEDLRGIVNSGHQRGRPYIRYDITTRKTEQMPTFCMAALAGIGDLPDTIMDRAVVVRMRRRAPGETVSPYRTRRDSPGLAQLRTKVNDWMKGWVDRLQAATPDMPVEDRAADTWEPLVAVADLAGGDWPARARKAVLLGVAQEADADAAGSLGLRLLSDIRDTFDNWTSTFLTTPDLLMALKKIDESPWREMDLSAERLARQLRPYGIRPGHNVTKTARGYSLESFTETFNRYIPRGNPSEPVHPSRNLADQQEGPDGFTNRTRPDPSSWTGLDGLENSTRPAVSAGQPHFLDGWTGLDGLVRESGPRGDQTVWCASLRRGIDAHMPDGALTVCGRSMRTGQLVILDEIRDLGPRPCPRCWPPPQEPADAQ